MITQYALENKLQQYVTSDGRTVYNLINAVYVDPTFISPALFSTYHICTGDAWTTISHKLYSTMDLWWLIYACNRDTLTTPVIMPPAGTAIRVPTQQLVQFILTQP